jgi:hypothetical protein
MTKLKPLTLNEGLAALPLETLAAVGENLGVAGELTSKARLLSVIPEKMQEADARRRLLQDLTAAERRALVVAAAAEELAPMLGPAALFAFASCEPEEGLARRGLILPDANTGLHRVPQELAAAVRALALKTLHTDGAGEPAGVVTLAPPSALRDAVSIWCHVWKNPVALTYSGAAPKRAVAKIVPLLEVDEDAPPLAAVVAAFGRSRVELLANELSARGALAAHGNELHAEPWPNVEGALRPAAFNAGLVAAAVERELTGGALLATFLAATMPADAWVSQDELTATVRGIAADAAGVADALFASFVGGYLAAAATEGGGVLVRRAREFAAPAEDDAEPTAVDLLVGGNFEVKAPRETPLAARLKLEAFADQATGGHLPSFLISKESVYRALDAGLAADDILPFLEANSSRPLPQNVAFSVRGWAAQYGAVAFADNLTLAVARDDLAEELVNLPALAPFLKGRRTVTAFDVARKDYAEARRALIAAGYLPRSLRTDADKAVSPRLLFAGSLGARREEVVAALPAGELTAAIVAFAVENRRRLKIWLADADDALDVKPLGLTSRGGERMLRLEGPEGRQHVPLEAITRAVIA